MAETVDAVVKAALRLLKVKESGEPLNADEATDGRIALNDLIEQMNLQSLFQVAKAQITQALTSGDGSYTFGSGGDNSLRPLEIHSAYVIKSNVSYPVSIISNQQYSYISFKTLSGGFSYNLYYRNSYPLSTIELYPVPSSGSQTLYLECRAELATYSLGSDSIDLPPGYLKYLKNQLAIDISPEYREPSPTVFKSAQDAMALIKRNNSSDKPSMINTARQAIHRNNGGGGYLFGVS